MSIASQLVRMSTSAWRYKIGNPIQGLKKCSNLHLRRSCTPVAYFCTTASYKETLRDDSVRLEGQTLWERLKKLHREREPHWRLLRGTHYLYESCTDSVDFLYFFKRFDLPDTYMSWFIVTELHVWMCVARAATEKRKFEDLKDTITQAMWKDVEERIRQLGSVVHISTKAKKEALTSLYSHFLNSLVSYDEGLLGDDKVLAAALWRRFFSMNCHNAEHLEIMVQYVRMQMAHLDKQDRETLFLKGTPSWLPLKELDVFKRDGLEQSSNSKKMLGVASLGSISA